MSEEKLKLLAQLMIANEARLDSLTELLYQLIECEVVAGRFPHTAAVLKSEIDQEHARIRDAAARRKNLRKIFEIPETDPVDAV